WPLFRAAFYAPRSPHLIARLKPWIYISDRPGGTGHGTAQEYDRRVPVAFLGSGVRRDGTKARRGRRRSRPPWPRGSTWPILYRTRNASSRRRWPIDMPTPRLLVIDDDVAF